MKYLFVYFILSLSIVNGYAGILDSLGFAMNDDNDDDSYDERGDDYYDDGLLSINTMPDLKDDTDDKNDTITFFRNLDTEFFTKIVIGQPGKTMQITFDTMSSNSWLISERCDVLRVNGCRFHNRYDHRKSSHYKKDNREFQDEKSELVGYYAYENITIGAHSKLKAFSFIEMTKVPSSFVTNKADGVFGLGSKTSFFHQLYQTKQISKPIFSVFLNRDIQSDRGGSIMLGYYTDRLVHKTNKNGKMVSDPIKYLPIDDGDHWRFAMDKVTIVTKVANANNPKNITLCSSGCKAVPNMASGKIFGPASDIMELNYEINAKLLDDNTWVVNCDTINLLPRIDFVLGGQTFSLEGRNYILKLTTDYATVCASAFTPSTDPEEKNTWILGAAFLSQYYSIYDIEKRTVGLVRTPN